MASRRSRSRWDSQRRAGCAVRRGSASRRAGRRRARRWRTRAGSGRSRAAAGSPGRCPSVRGCGPRRVLAGGRPRPGPHHGRAASIAASAVAASAARASMHWDTVGSEATGPNTCGYARSWATSARQSRPMPRRSPDPARSCPDRAGRTAATRAPAPRSVPGPDRRWSPSGSAATPPVPDTTLRPVASTARRGYSPLCFFTWKVLFGQSGQVPRQDPSLLARSTFQLVATGLMRPNGESPGLGAC
jgi:hypothetical protein